MPRKPSSHFVAHVVTAFVNRLSQAIHELAAARAHSEMLGALGGFRTPAKSLAKARGPAPKAKAAKQAATEATKQAATKAAKTPEKAAAKAASKAAAKTATKKMAKATAKAKPRAVAKANAKLAAARPAAVATRSQGKRKRGVVSSPARMLAVKAAAAAPAPTAPAAPSEPPAVPPGSVLASETAAPATVG